MLFVAKDCDGEDLSRLLRLFFIILGSCFGLYGIGTGVFIYSVYLASLNNFGIKFLSPLPGQGIKNLKKSVLIMRLEREQKFCFTIQGFDIIDVFVRMI